MDKICDEASLSDGISSFISLRQAHKIYVDKTDAIYKLAKLERAFFIRPRRFGKSLLISALETLFRDGLKWFEGLAISKLWDEKTYKVLKLDFSRLEEFSSVDDFLHVFQFILNQAFQKEKIPFHFLPEERPEEILNRFLMGVPDKSIVLLIDECDAPLNAYLKNRTIFNEIEECINRFFSVVKSKYSSFRFIFLTGINKLDIFSGLDDVSLMSQYATLLGYTEKEIISYFGMYLENIARMCGVRKEKIIEDMRERYGGFCFDLKASTQVYNPWSVLKFFRHPSNGFFNYWYMTSGCPAVLAEYLQDEKFFWAEQYNKHIDIPLSRLISSYGACNLNDEALLFRAGYLTIKKIVDGRVYLEYPNQEIALSMLNLSIDYIFYGAQNLEIDDYSLAESFVKDPKFVVDKLNDIFQKIHYDQYPVSSESACRAIVQLLFLGARWNPVTEQGNGGGRSDLEVSVAGAHWIFTFKFLASGGADKEGAKNKRGKTLIAKAIGLLAEALEEMRKRRCGEGSSEQKNQIRLALVFSEAEREFVEWQTLPLTKRDVDVHGKRLPRGWNARLASKLQKAGWDEEDLGVLKDDVQG